MAAPVANPRLTDVGETWLRHRMNERGQQHVNRRQRLAMRKARQRSPLTSHMRDTLTRWQSFVDCIGNVRIAELTAAHFRRFHEWADRESAHKASNRWHGQLMSAIKNVFNCTQRHYADWAWPVGISVFTHVTACQLADGPMPPCISQASTTSLPPWPLG